MLKKKAKAVNGLHNEYFIIERKIVSEINKLQKRAKSDFKRLLRRSNVRAKIRFSSLQEDAFTRSWEPRIYVESVWGFDEYDELAIFCLRASEEIGVEFIADGVDKEPPPP